MQYLFDGIEHPVQPSAHGNSKRKRSSPYVRTKESTVQKLQRESSVQTPKAAYHTVHKEKGVSWGTISDLPMELKQNMPDVSTHE